MMEKSSPGQLTPVWIIVYLALHQIWQQIVMGDYSFVLLRVLFLLGVAIFLTHHHRANEIPGYFLGRIVPDLTIFQIVLIIGVVVVLRLALIFDNSFPPENIRGLVGDCLMAPINEEMVFRGLFMAILLQQMPTRPYIAIALER
jgi:hypothetical protein